MTIKVYWRDVERGFKEWHQKIDEAMTRLLQDPDFIRALEAEPDLKKREAMLRVRCDELKRVAEVARAEMDASLLAGAIDAAEDENESASN